MVQAWRSLGLLLVLLLAVSVGSDAGAGGAALGPAAGQLDRSFGTGGKVITDLGQAELAAGAVVQPDERIVVAGVLRDLAPGGASQMLAARYLADGRLDQGFGTGGTATIRFGVRVSQANGLALQRDGKLVLVGSAGSGATPDPGATGDFALARANPDGSLDASFGPGGRVTTDLGGTVDIAIGVALQPDGKIVVAGATRQPGPLESNPTDFALARYNPDGSLDTSFGAGGHTSTHFEDGGYVAFGVALQPDGKIVVVGSSFHQPLSRPPPVLMLARYDRDGTLDPTFGGDGWVTRANATGSDVAVVRGKIVVGGSSLKLALWRYTPGGTPDATFDRGGVARAVGLNGSASRIAVQPDGEIVAAGSVTATSGHVDFAVARFDANGQPDPAFGSEGTQSTGFRRNSDDAASGLALTRNGKIVLVGNIFASPGSLDDDIALARYHGRVCVVPNVLEKPLPTARKAITKSQCAVGTVRRVFSTRVDTGRVVSQKPTAGTRQRLRAPVALIVSKGRPRR